MHIQRPHPRVRRVVEAAAGCFAAIGLLACGGSLTAVPPATPITPLEACAPSLGIPVADAEFAVVIAALDAERWSDAVVAAEQRLETVTAHAAALFHTPPPAPLPVECVTPDGQQLGLQAAPTSDPARSARAAEYRRFLARWVYTHDATLRFGRDRFLLNERLALGLAAASLQIGDEPGALRWLDRAGAPWETGETLDRCWAALAPPSALDRAQAVGAVEEDALDPLATDVVASNLATSLEAPQ